VPSSPNTDRRALALTLGDPSGIGCELALKAWLARKPSGRPFFLLGDPDHADRTAKALQLPVPITIASPSQAGTLFAKALPVVPLHHRVKGIPGRPQAADAAATIEAIMTAVALVHQEQAAAVVTNPIAKDGLHRVGFAHPGHTEYLAELANHHWGGAYQPVMMLWSPTLAVVPVTVHVALALVPTLLSEQLIVTTGQIVARELRRRFGIERPRLALCGLNPHAGEHGIMGREEITIIGPAIAALNALDIAASGPFPADSLFHEAARRTYDAAIAMYHDQGLIPIKTLAFDDAVNVTLGLPLVRTSPDHGTAFNIAGRGVANPASLVAALELASRLVDT
jgi:4-hydroxythreonine-4-phosphate dehydrogenase